MANIELADLKGGGHYYLPADRGTVKVDWDEYMKIDGCEITFDADPDHDRILYVSIQAKLARVQKTRQLFAFGISINNDNPDHHRRAGWFKEGVSERAHPYLEIPANFHAYINLAQQNDSGTVGPFNIETKARANTDGSAELEDLTMSILVFP
ncbi:MAG: hypothetical protein JJ902_23060 [Roseibium sp.]|nr:hypothetical protein [Roseibium sp.]